MSARPSLVIASRNAKKRREIEELLAPHGIEVLNVADFPDVPEVTEFLSPVISRQQITRRLSSVVEHSFRKAGVQGSNP